MTTTPTLRRLAALALALTALCTPAVQAVETGAPAPALALPTAQGSVDLAALKGKVVYVDFWASWCGPCKQSFPFMNALQAKYRDQGLEIVAVNLDAKREDADRFLGQVPAQFTVAFDPKGDSAKRYGVKAMPSSYLVGRDGSIVATHRGFRDDDRPAIEGHITKALTAR